MPATVDSILGDSGPVAALLGSAFEARPEQLRMAGAVARAMESRSHLLVEAGTGVGKSYAYLVPAMLRCLTSGDTVVVATNTISLQEQLMEKDVPLLAGVMEKLAESDPAFLGPDGQPRKLKPVLVKGRGNYVSLRRLQLASQRQDRLFSEGAQLRSLRVIEEWAMTTRDGTLSTLPALERPGVWDRVQSDSGNCMGRRCPNYSKCFYQTARAELDSANLLICNHALFFSDLALRSQDVAILPEYQHVILDEAHNVEDVAADHFGISLTEGRVNHLLSTLVQSRGGRGYLPQLGLAVTDASLVDKAVLLVHDAHAASRAFFESLLSVGDEHAARGDRESARSVRVRRAGIVPNVLTPVMRELSMRLKALKDSAVQDADRFELQAYAIRAENIAADAEALISQSHGGDAYWVEVSGEDDAPRGSFQKITLACAPVEVGPVLKTHLFGGEHSVVLTSATLATRTIGQDETRERAETAFAHAMARLGCEGAQTLQLGSPFDYSRQVEFFVDRGSDPRGDGDDGRSHSDILAAKILEHVRATDGGAFVLFTSFASLNAVASRLAGPLSRLGFPLLAQGRDGSRTQILQRFREDTHSVLLGAASFWQGVDVRGRGLRNVIITKLPFDPPDRPLTQARLELIEARGGNAFMEDSLPRAVIRFKQGFGRLIRSRTDTGRVVVLDPRIVTARYGRYFLNALPEGVEVRAVED